MRFFQRLSLFVCLLLLVQGGALNAQTKSPSGYHVVKQIKLGGEGSWDYLTVDPKARRVYISRSTHVMVVDADTGAIAGDIPDTAGVHGIAFVPELNRGFTSNGRANSVTVFDLKTLKALKQIPVGKNPDAIIYDPASKRVFTFNGGSSDATAIDAKTETVVGTVALGSRPEFAVSDEKGRVYVNLEDKSEIVEFDPGKLAVAARWPLAPGEEPTGLALDQRHKRLFSACANKLMVVMDAGSGKVLARLPIGDCAYAANSDPATHLAFASSGKGVIGPAEVGATQIARVRVAGPV